MTEWTRPRVLPAVRNSRFTRKAAIATIILILTVFVVVYTQAKTIEVQIDGKTVEVTTLSDNVGRALRFSHLGIYQEDLVSPSRDTEITAGLKVQVTRSVPVSLTVDGKVIKGRSPTPTVGGALADLSNRYDLRILDVDEVNVSRSEALKEDMSLVVTRAIPIHVSADGKQWDTYLAPRTVSQALDKLGISLGAKDRVSIPLDHLLQPYDTLEVVRVAERVETVKTDLPYQVVAKPADFPIGLPDRVISGGKRGLQEQTVKVTYENGQEVDREVLSQRILSEPVTQVVARGTQDTISRGGKNIRFKRAYVMRATAYNIPGGITATGDAVRWGVIAVDPRVIPLGTHLYVEGYGEATALDTGGAIKGNRIDLYMNSWDAAVSWGVRDVIVYVE